MFGSCAFMCIDSAQNESIRFYGVLKREEYADVI